MNETADSSMRFSRSIVYCSAAILIAILIVAAVYMFLQITQTGLGRTHGLTISATLVTLIIHFGLIQIATIVGYNGRVAPAMIVAMICSLIATVFWLLLAWFDHIFETGRLGTGRQQEHLVICALTFSILAAALVHMGGFACLRTRGGVLRGLKWGTVVLLWIAVVTAVLSMWFAHLFRWPPGLDRIVLPILIPSSSAALLLTIAVPAITRQQNHRWEAARESVTERVSVQLGCPKCGHEHSAPTGVSHCPDCKAVLTIELEEPRCECGYLLYRLGGSTCPECGRAIPAERRWPQAAVRKEVDTTRATDEPKAIESNEYGKH